jgi:hypothetical protein
MNRTLKWLFAVVAVAGFSGCATTQVTDERGAEAAPAETQVLKALPSYGSLGGYRYRRFAVVAARAS